MLWVSKILIFYYKDIEKNVSIRKKYVILLIYLYLGGIFVNEKVKEIFIMRAFACSAVVLLHSIAVIQGLYELSASADSFFRSLQLILLFSTPMFVFISEFVLSYSYGTTLPDGFFQKRLKMIMVPTFSLVVSMP